MMQALAIVLALILVAAVLLYAHQGYMEGKMRPRKEAADLSSNLILSSSEVETYQLFRNIICHNQGAYVQYHYLLSEMHRSLKHHYFMEDIPKSSLEKVVHDFRESASKRLYGVMEENFKLLHDYFALRDGGTPRVCVKFNFTDIGLAPLKRDKAETYDSHYAIDANTAHAMSRKTGLWYIENDIPRAVFDGTYNNPRIDMKAIEVWKTQNRFDTKDEAVSALSRAWGSFWAQAGSEKSHYRSTLVVPITFWNNQFADEFLNLVNERIPNFKETIFGFVCLDSTNTNYFSKDKDVAIGYAIADSLSLYIFIRMLYINFSHTVKGIENNTPAPTNRKVDDVADMVTKGLSQGAGERSDRRPRTPLKIYDWDPAERKSMN